MRGGNGDGKEAGAELGKDDGRGLGKGEAGHGKGELDLVDLHAGAVDVL